MQDTGHVYLCTFRILYFSFSDITTNFFYINETKLYLRNKRPQTYLFGQQPFHDTNNHPSKKLSTNIKMAYNAVMSDARVQSIV